MEKEAQVTGEKVESHVHREPEVAMLVDIDDNNATNMDTEEWGISQVGTDSGTSGFHLDPDLAQMLMETLDNYPTLPSVVGHNSNDI